MHTKCLNLNSTSSPWTPHLRIWKPPAKNCRKYCVNNIWHRCGPRLTFGWWETTINLDIPPQPKGRGDIITCPLWLQSSILKSFKVMWSPGQHTHTHVLMETPLHRFWQDNLDLTYIKHLWYMVTMQNISYSCVRYHTIWQMLWQHRHKYTMF